MCGDAYFVQRKLVAYIHTRCRMTPSLRANATLVRFIPRRFAISHAERRANMPTADYKETEAGGIDPNRVLTLHFQAD